MRHLVAAVLLVAAAGPYLVVSILAPGDWPYDLSNTYTVTRPLAK